MLLKLDNICKSFGDTVAVDSLTLEVPEGVIYGIIGPNGLRFKLNPGTVSKWNTCMGSAPHSRKSSSG